MLCEAGATAGVDVRGSAPGTRETDLLSPTNQVQQVNAILLSGGSAYGSSTQPSGVMRWLEEHNAGYKIGTLGVVPIVPAAILMDLGVGNFKNSSECRSPATRPALLRPREPVPG